MVIYMLAVERRQQHWVPAEQFSRTAAALKAFSKERKAKTSGCMNAQVPPFADWAKEQHSGGSSNVVSGRQRSQTQSSATALK